MYIGGVASTSFSGVERRRRKTKEAEQQKKVPRHDDDAPDASRSFAEGKSGIGFNECQEKENYTAGCFQNIFRKSYSN